jgi:serine/threonine protein kinase
VIGTTLNQRFSLDKELGRGGMGAVYRATDLVLQRPVAIKILKEQTGDEVGAKIRLEAQILARLVHEHIVRIYDFGESNGLYYLVMEEVDGSSFYRRSRTLALPGRLAVLAQVADALDYAHHQGVVHRDVKPANVLLTASDSARLSDFGLSVLMESVQESGLIRGTPHYMSPEQAKGKRLDHRSDLYALGVMMYECSTGSPPFSGPPFAVIASHIGAEPETPRSRNPAISPELEALILKLMAKSPEARPSSGSSVAAALRDLLTRDATLRPADRSAASSMSGGPATIASVDAQGEVVGSRRVAATIEAGATSTPGSQSVPLLATGGSSSELAAVPTGVSPRSRPSDSGGSSAKSLAAGLLAEIVSRPIPLAPDERYLTGHYLAYLLGGSRRQGFLRRRPLDPLNADRARLVLAMTWLMNVGPTDAAIASAAELLDSRPEVRPSLSPIVVAKYLACRDSLPKRKMFRDARKRLQQASSYAREHMTDVRGMLNPGLMPQVLDDLQKIAPARTEVDDRLVERWNRVAEVWRDGSDFRQAVLGYATTSAASDPASVALWPEVVYPLIERARWQRQLRSKPEVVWDGMCDVLHIPDAGNRLERAIRTVVPARVVEQLDVELRAFASQPELQVFDEAAAAHDDPSVRLMVKSGSTSYDDLDTDLARSKGLVRLAKPDPIRLTHGELHDLWQEGIAAIRVPGSKAVHRNVPLGPYRLAVIPSIRGRSAGQVAIQGMPNKQIELLTPSLRLAGSASKPIVAVWHYQDDSLVIAYLDFRNTARYVFWQAPIGHQNNYDDLADLNHALFTAGLEVPDGLHLSLSKRFRPKNPA